MRKRGRGMFPAPVLVAYFGRGEHVRLSFWQPPGKPWRFGPALGYACQVIGNERGNRTRALWSAMPVSGHPPATDVLAYHVEHDGVVYRDEPKLSARERRARKPKRIINLPQAAYNEERRKWKHTKRGLRSSGRSARGHTTQTA